MNKMSKRTGWIDSSEDRPEWQKERGERHGNNRKMYAKEKVLKRRQERKSKNERMETF